ncbi:MAG: efflux RND transporter periplasmic adaptor subunit [Verrucomicrobium sp.]
MIKRIRSKTGMVGLATLAVALCVWFITGRSDDKTSDVPLIPVQKGTIQINVLQGGEIRALQNTEVKSEIELPTKILSLIPEGYRITEEDVKNGKVLIELDSADLKDKITNHEIEFQTTVSVFIEADEQRAIQMSDNQSLARDAEQAMRFALMDFERYMGKGNAQEVLKSRKLPHDLEALEFYIGKLNAEKPRIMNLEVDADKADKASDDPLAEKEGKVDPLNATQELPDPAKVAEKPEGVVKAMDFIAFLAQTEMGDGEAEQKLRQLSNELLLHKSELALAKQNVEASERLAAKEFITKTTLENDQVNFEKTKLSVQTAETQLDLFKKYEFPKQAEVALSAYQEALKKLQRTLRANRSRMAQVESKFRTAKRRYEVELSRKEELDRQLKACVIKAPVPGLVAYGSHTGNSGFRSNDVIEEGAAVRFRQTLLTIPNMSRMGVAVNIHESQMKKVRISQPCRVTLDAEQGKTLDGVVAELAVLPDSSSSRYTPNLKVYPAVVHVDGTHDWLKPGMNAKVEIIVNQLEDILYVPVQSIEVENDHYFTYVNTGSTLERREVKTGSFNDQFIEIKGGLDLGEQVALAIPKRQVMESNPSALPSAPASKKPKDKAPVAEKKGLALK